MTQIITTSFKLGPVISTISSIVIPLIFNFKATFRFDLNGAPRKFFFLYMLKYAVHQLPWKSTEYNPSLKIILDSVKYSGVSFIHHNGGLYDYTQKNSNVFP
jgi:hypothetical protein